MSDLLYEENNKILNKEHNCFDIKCRNHELCNTLIPLSYASAVSFNYICSSCCITFGTSPFSGISRGKGKLDFKDNIECPICLDCKRGISQPRCDHYTCVDCFKRCYYGDNSDEPQFPYPEIENEYLLDIDDKNKRWEQNYPLITKWVEDYNNWYDKNNIKWENEEHLRQCPLCRK